MGLCSKNTPRQLRRYHGRYDKVSLPQLERRKYSDDTLQVERAN